MTWGDLAEFSVLDARQYRDDQPCGDGEFPRCEASLDPDVTMLGFEQEAWLRDGLEDSRARWNVIAQQVMMGQLDHDRGDPRIYWHDAWDGYPVARQRIIDHLAEARIRNPMIITGDWHSTFVNDIKADFSDPGSATVATEFVGTSISSNGDFPVYGPYYGPMIDGEPAHQVLRRGPARLRPLPGRSRGVAHRPADGQDGEPQRRPGLHLRVVRGRGRAAGGGSGLDDVLHQQLVLPFAAELVEVRLAGDAAGRKPTFS